MFESRFETIKFDERIDKDLIDVYTIFNRFSNDLLGTTVYASNAIKNFQNLENCKKGIVDHINKHGFAVTLENDDTLFFDFVIPAFSVKVEKTLKPYTVVEFENNLDKMIYSDGLIHFRPKGSKTQHYALRYNGYISNNKDTVYCLGSREYSAEDLFKNFEYLYKNDNWNVFGVEE